MVPGALQQITVQKRAVVGGRGMRRGHAMLRRPEGATVDEVTSQRLDARFGLQPSGGDQMLYRSSLDSPLEEGVSCELVSEAGSVSGRMTRGPPGAISRNLGSTPRTYLTKGVCEQRQKRGV